jgi:hypothetical protein
MVFPECPPIDICSMKLFSPFRKPFLCFSLKYLIMSPRIKTKIIIKQGGYGRPQRGKGKNRL